MRYALISDIHANLPALDAVLSHIAARRVRRDLSPGRFGWLRALAKRSVERIRAAGIPGVAGNYDSTVATDYKHCGCRYEDPRQEELSHLSYAWTREHVSAATKSWLGNPAVPNRSPPARRTCLRANADACSRQPDAQYGVRHRRSVGRFSGEDGSGGRRAIGRHRRVRPHAQTVAPRGRRRAFREYGQRRPTEGRRLARGLRVARARASRCFG